MLCRDEVVKQLLHFIVLTIELVNNNIYKLYICGNHRGNSYHAMNTGQNFTVFGVV